MNYQQWEKPTLEQIGLLFLVTLNLVALGRILTDLPVIGVILLVAETALVSFLFGFKAGLGK
tara:strand:+ start:200 stop:385 length:186 start_codon:yes stop_codon:yes gene_type:complete